MSRALNLLVPIRIKCNNFTSQTSKIQNLLLILYYNNKKCEDKWCSLRLFLLSQVIRSTKGLLELEILQIMMIAVRLQKFSMKPFKTIRFSIIQFPFCSVTIVIWNDASESTTVSTRGCNSMPKCRRSAKRAI